MQLRGVVRLSTSDGDGEGTAASGLPLVSLTSLRVLELLWGDFFFCSSSSSTSASLELPSRSSPPVGRLPLATASARLAAPFLPILFVRKSMNWSAGSASATFRDGTASVCRLSREFSVLLSSESASQRAEMPASPIELDKRSMLLQSAR